MRIGIIHVLWPELGAGIAHLSQDVAAGLEQGHVHRHTLLHSRVENLHHDIAPTVPARARASAGRLLPGAVGDVPPQRGLVHLGDAAGAEGALEVDGLKDIIQRQRPTPAHHPAKQTVGAQGLEQHASTVLRRVRGDGRVQPPRDLHAERRVEEVGSGGGPLPKLDRRRLQHP